MNEIINLNESKESFQEEYPNEDEISLLTAI